MTKKTIALLATALAFSAPLLAESGKDVYSKVCVTCHGSGLAGAPRYGNAADWTPRLAGGMAGLYQSALKGTPKGMPAKGGHLTLADADVKAAVDYMVGAVKDAAKLAKAEPEAKKEEPKKPEPKKEEPKKLEVKPTVAPAPVAAVPSMPVAEAASSGAAAAAAGSADANSFNRLLKPASKRNLPPPEDGIHDPTNDGTHALQPPLAAFGALPKSFAGNRINWVEAIGQKKINPRYDRNDPKAEPIVMDLNIVREVKGSMPDVVYPHKQHTEWLDCSNCHPAIFVPQKGANQISMAAILMGEKCGVCHGKVAFPVSECRNCHSKKKDMAKVASPADAGK
ncbi:MAG: cytochrome C [Rhodocyclales bacterium GT-UBC]|nr:MAG: cytochrome C [Rhodocyclales bacterium GT-UBC]